MLGPILGAVGTLAGLASSGIGALSSGKAAREQQRAADEAARQVTGAYQTATGQWTPYTQAGQQGLSELRTQDYTVPAQKLQYEQLGPQQNFAYDQYADPGAQFRMQQGQQAVMGSAAAGGAGLSGSTLKALAKYGSDLGSQEYGNAYQRYMQQRQQGQSEQGQRFNQAQGAANDYYNQQLNAQNQRYGQAGALAGYGQTGATALSDLATGYGGNMADIIAAKANAGAAGTMGQGQGWANTLSNLGQVANLGAAAFGAGGKSNSGNMKGMNPNDLPYLKNSQLATFNPYDKSTW